MTDYEVIEKFKHCADNADLFYWNSSHDVDEDVPFAVEDGKIYVQYRAIPYGVKDVRTIKYRNDCLMDENYVLVVMKNGDLLYFEEWDYRCTLRLMVEGEPVMKNREVWNYWDQGSKPDSEIFAEAYHFLQNHEIYRGEFLRNLDVELVKVDPETNAVDLEDDSRNKKLRIWLESGPWNNGLTHDPRLDCEGDTFEEAIVALAELVRTHYGENQIEPTGQFRMVILD